MEEVHRFNFYIQKKKYRRIQEIALDKEKTAADIVNQFINDGLREFLQPEHDNPYAIPYSNGDLDIKQPQPTDKEIEDNFLNNEIDKILPIIAHKNMDEWERFQKEFKSRIYGVRGPNKEKILEELRRKHQKSNMDTVVPSSSQAREREPEISIKKELQC